MNRLAENTVSTIEQLGQVAQGSHTLTEQNMCPGHPLGHHTEPSRPRDSLSSIDSVQTPPALVTIELPSIESGEKNTNEGHIIIIIS
jgi:hypothetical protein